MNSANFLSTLTKYIIANEKFLAINLCCARWGYVNEHVYETFSTIIEHINRHNYTQGLPVFQTAEAVLQHVITLCTYDDVILCLHKELSETEDTIKFSHLLSPLKYALRQLPSTKFEFAIWCLNAIESYTKNVSKECLSTPSNEVNEMYQSTFAFYISMMTTYRTERESNIIAKFCLQLFGHSWACFDTTLTDHCSPMLLIRYFISAISSVHNPFKFFSWLQFRQRHDDDIEVDRLALANFFACIFIDELLWRRVPKVYSNEFIFHHAFFYITELLKRNDGRYTDRALQFAETLLYMRDISSHLLDDAIHCEFTLTIDQVIAFSSNTNHRRLALMIFRKYISCFDARGRYQIVMNAFKTLEHAGVKGYLIVIYKDFMAAELQKGVELSVYYAGGKLAAMIETFCDLPNNIDVSNVNSADVIVSLLNFLLYGCKCDRKDQTNIRSLTKRLEPIYLEPLMQYITTAKAEYRSQVNNIQRGIAGDAEMSMQVINGGGEQVVDLSKDEKICNVSSLEMQLAFIESLIIHLRSCVDNS